MKNNILYFVFLFLFIFNASLIAQEIEINSSKVKYDDINKITVFEDNVNSIDEKGNKFFSDYAEYNKLDELITTKGKTKIITSMGYEVLGSNIFFDRKKNTIYSNNRTKIVDIDGNKILVDMFSYSILNNIFFSKGNIIVNDINQNNYNFSEVYIDENKKKIIGSDIKAFLGQDDISISDSNEPRLFANTMSLTKNINILEKGIFTYCKNREGDKCPPWALQSKKIKHDLAKKTIYYENVVLKIYDFPVFFAPRFSHPDPTVKRRSGLLAPSFSTSTGLGSGFATPYFWDIADDKDLTMTPKLYAIHKPLMLTEYRQVFADSSLIIDTGYTPGYKKKSNKKTDGGRAHFFSNFNMRLLDEEDKKSTFEVNIEKVSNDTYLKIHEVSGSLAKKDKVVMDNKLDFNYQNRDFYLGVTPSVYEDTSKSGNLRHEYLLPLSIEKNIMTSDKYGFLKLGSNIKIRNYDTNKQTNHFVNDFNWQSNKWLNSLGVENYFEGLIKTVNYEAENTKEYKNNKKNSELNSALGYFAKLGMYKNDFINKNYYTFTPKFLLRYSPGHMRKVKGGKLNYSNLFNMNKINEFDVVENGLSSSIGFEYKKNKLNQSNDLGDKVFSFSVGQVISEKENMDIPSSTSLDQRFSDIVGTSNYNINNKIGLKYNFSLDQGYKHFNYNEVGADFMMDKAKFNVSYLQEKNHIGNQEFVETSFDFNLNSSSELSFGTKRNLLRSSAEFYNLSYNYINDCLKAGLAYRREFYTDRDVEPANSLMFTISLIPFAKINSPGLSK